MKDFKRIWKKKIKVLSMGNCNVDVVYIVDKIPSSDEETIAKKVFLYPGGSASNIAVAVSKLGHTSGIIGFIGNDRYGTFLKDNFIRNKVDIRGLNIVEGETGRVIILVEESTGKRAMIAYRGVNTKIYEIDIPNNILRDVDNFHISSISASIVLEKLYKVKRRNIFITYDPGSIPVRFEYNLFPRVLELINILFLNKKEYNFLKKKDVLNNIKDTMVVVKLGKEGSMVLTDNVKVKVKGYNVKVKDTTGAGDAFDAGFIVCWHTLFDVKKCSIFANAVAALKIQNYGAQSVPNIDEVISFLEKR